MTRNKVRDFARSRVDREAAVGGTDYHAFLEQVPGESDQEESVNRDPGLYGRALEAIRAEFEQRTWQAFWRTAVDEQNATQVGEELRMSATAVRNAKSRILRRLREMLVDPLD